MEKIYAMKKLKELGLVIRLNIKKPPKVEIPKNVYTRKVKHKKSLKQREFGLFYFLHFLMVSLLMRHNAPYRKLSLRRHYEKHRSNPNSHKRKMLLILSI